jgi:hypothetical protein
MGDQAAQPIQLPLITQCLAAMPSSDLRGGGNEPTITIQLKTLGGQIYLVPLSVLAARGLLAALALWPPAADVGRAPEIRAAHPMRTAIVRVIPHLNLMDLLEAAINPARTP